MVRLIIKFVRTLTLNKVAIFAAMSFLTIVGITFWENRDKLSELGNRTSDTAYMSMTWTVSDKTKKAIINLVETDPKIIAASVMSVDIRFNEVRPVFFYSTDQSLIGSVAFDTESRFSRIPLFSFSEKAAENAIKLINGEFNCIPFSETSIGVLYPELGDIFKYVCRSSIPSYYGHFSGFVAVYLTEQPSAAKQAQLEITLQKLSNEIFFEDVVRTRRFQKSELPLRIM